VALQSPVQSPALSIVSPDYFSYRRYPWAYMPRCAHTGTVDSEAVRAVPG
jgi:hypothetical protein